MVMIEMKGDDGGAAGEQLLSDAIESYIRARGETFPAVGAVRIHLGRALAGRGAYAEVD